MNNTILKAALSLIVFSVGALPLAAWAQTGAAIEDSLIEVALLDGGAVAMSVPEPDDLFASLGRGRIGDVSIRGVGAVGGALRLTGVNTAFTAPDSVENIFFYDASVGRRGGDSALVMACLYARSNSHLALFTEEEVFFKGGSLVASYREGVDNGLYRFPDSVAVGDEVSFSGFNGLGVSVDRGGLAAFVSCVNVQSAGGALIERGTSAPADRIDGFVLRVNLEGRVAERGLSCDIVANGFYPKLSRPDAGDEAWMVTRAMHVDTPSKLILWEQGLEGEWNRLELGNVAQKASREFDIFVNSTHVYLGAWHYPRHEGGRLTVEDVNEAELGVWAFDRRLRFWSRVLIPETSAGSVRDQKMEVRLIHAQNENRPMMAFGASLASGRMMYIDRLPTSPIQD